MLFKDFVIQILEVPCWKLKQIHPSYQVFPRAKHGNPLSGWHRHRCFPRSPPATFPLILLYKSSLDYAMIKKKEWKITQESGKGHMEPSQLQLVVGWICDALNTRTIYLWCRTTSAWSGICSLFTQSHPEGKQIFGLGIFVCGCTQGSKAGWKMELFCVFPRAVILYLWWSKVGAILWEVIPGSR